MSKLDLGRVGVVLNVSAADAYLVEAAELERSGYSALWLPGGQIDRLDRIAAVIGATTAIPVAPGIISPDVYDADAVTGLYAQMQATAPDRPGATRARSCLASTSTSRPAPITLCSARSTAATNPARSRSREKSPTG